MSRRESRLVIGRRSLLGGALVGGVGAALGGRGSASAAVVPRPMGVSPVQSAGMLYMLVTPVRAYDSRVGSAPNGTDPNTGASDTRLVEGNTRKIDIAMVLGDVFQPTRVETTSRAVLLNLTAVNTLGASGFLKVWAWSSPVEPTISALNWDHTNAVIANSVTTRHNNGYINVACGGVDGASTNFIVDVLGYYDNPI